MKCQTIKSFQSIWTFLFSFWICPRKTNAVYLLYSIKKKKTRFLFFSISTFCEDLCSLVFFVAVMLCFLSVHVKVLLSAFLFPLSHSHTRFQVQSSTRVSLLVNYPSLCLSLWFSVVLRHIICFINFEKIFFFIRFITVSLWLFWGFFFFSCSSSSNSLQK